MSSLALLPASTVHRIASSQVITSVSSAIKELVENSLDAGADNVEVKLMEYGLNRLEVRDNGHGITTTDAQVMAQRHYTSKIKNFENLSELSTYGFRGEALCSLCAVGDVVITTKTKGDTVAQCYTLGPTGHITSVKPTSSSTGTIVVVSNLFKNLPVRKQFVSSSKKCKEDLKKTEEIVMAFGAIHPEIRLVLWHNKSIIWQKSKVSDYRTSLMNVFGTVVMSQMDRIDFKDEDSGFEIVGYLPKPSADSNITCRTNGDRCFIFVNKRPVIIKDVLQLVRQHFPSAGSRHPFMFLSITLPPNEVDVNLEPNKTRVMLTEKEQLLEVVKNLLENFYGHPTTKNEQLHSRNSKPHQGINLVSNPSDNDNHNVNILDKDHQVLHSFDGDSITHDKANSCHHNVEKSELHESNISDLQVDNYFTPIASSTLSTTQCDILLSSTVYDSVEQNASAKSPKSQVASFCSLKALNVEKRNSNHESQNHNSTPSSFNATNNHRCVVPLTQNENTDNKCLTVDKTNSVDNEKVSQTTDCSNTISSFTKSLTEQLSNGADVDIRAKSKANSENIGTQDILDTTVLRKEDLENIDQLLDLVEHDDTQTTRDQRLANDRQPKGATSFKFDDVLDDDLEFDKILQDIADKQISSQTLQPQSQTANTNENSGSVNIGNAVSEKEWSTGNVLKDIQENVVEPVRLVVPSPIKTHNNTAPLLRTSSANTSFTTGNTNLTTSSVLGKRKHFSDSKSKRKLSTSKKANNIPQIMNQSLITLHASQSPQERMKQATKADVQFSMLDLRNASTMANSIKEDNDLEKDKLIGWLEPSGTWLMLQQHQLLYVNHHRIQEQILYHKLIQTHVLPCEKLNKPIHLNPRIVGGDACWDILVNLDTQSDLLSSARLVKDERIKSNGFEVRIKHDLDDNELKVDLLSISTSLPFYGVPDLAEILGLIEAKGEESCSLEESRPLKVINYLKGEAVRICRAQMSRRTKEDVQSLLHQMNDSLPKDVQSCIHDQPFFGNIADLSKCLS